MKSIGTNMNKVAWIFHELPHRPFQCILAVLILINGDHRRSGRLHAGPTFSDGPERWCHREIHRRRQRRHRTGGAGRHGGAQYGKKEINVTMKNNVLLGFVFTYDVLFLYASDLWGRIYYSWREMSRRNVR